jgi:NAD(P)H dehydrogenase (quinone)
MRVLIVLAHPRPDSFNHALARELCAGLADAGHEVDLADLYSEGFRPELDAGDFRTFGQGATPPDIQTYQERVSAAQALAFVFPVWWFSPPAMVKGFVERVFFEGFAFRFGRGGRVVGLLNHEKALVMNTGGASSAMVQLFGFAKPLDQTFCEWTLKFCGIRKVHRVLFHGTTDASEAERARYLSEARHLGAEFFGK